MRLYRFAYPRRARLARALAGLAVVATLAACNTTPEADSVGGKILRGTSEPAKAIDLESLRARSECPQVEIRNGTETLAVYERGMDGVAEGLRYQASIQRTARECFFSGGLLTMKVGVAGRILAGPKGIGGSGSAPIRLAVVKSGEPDEVLYSQVRNVSASFAAGNPGVDFSEVDDNVNVPAPAPGESYRVFVGFDAKPGK